MTTFDNIGIDERFVLRDVVYIKVTTTGAVPQERVVRFDPNVLVRRDDGDELVKAARILDALVDARLIDDTRGASVRPDALRTIREALAINR